MADFNKVGLLITRDNTFLVCRKNNYTSKLIMPGGQIEPGETLIECLEREVQEELGDVRLSNISEVGEYLDVAASDDPTIHKTVSIKLYSADLEGVPTPCSEITELIWFSATDDPQDLSPIIANKIMPDLISRRLI